MKISLCKLTEEENIKFNEKVAAYSKFLEIFGDRIISFRSVANKFTPKEILSEEMNASAKNIGAPENIFDRIYTVSYNSGKYINDARATGIVTEETMTNLFDTILENSKDSLCVTEYTFWELFGKGKDIFYKIINNKKTHLFEQKNIINMIDNTIANDEFDDDFVTKVLEAFPSYNGFILTLTNPNVPYERKYNTLKKSFKQKYFNDYVCQLSKNMTDLNDLDTFIDITIINNNRIREKTKNIWNVFRRIFIGTKLVGVSYKNDLKNKKAFFDKYSKIITPAILAELVEDMYTDYSINNNMSSLISDMYGELDLNDRLDLCISNDYMFRSIIPQSTKSLFLNHTEPEIRNKVLKLSTKRDGNGGLSSLVNIFSKDIIPFLNEHHDPSVLTDAMISVTHADDAQNAKLFNMLTDDIFDKHVNIYRDAFVKSLFLIADITLYRALEQTERAKNFMTSLLANASESKKQSIYNKVFAKLEDEDFATDILQLGSDIIADKNTNIRSNYCRSYWNSGTDVKNLLKTNANWFKDTIKKYYPDKTDVINTLEEFVVSFELLDNI